MLSIREYTKMTLKSTSLPISCLQLSMSSIFIPLNIHSILILIFSAPYVTYVTVLLKVILLMIGCFILFFILAMEIVTCFVTR